MKKLTSLSFAALLPLTAAVVFAQQGPKPKIAEAQARATALALVPGGKVQAHELETEDGALIYSYEIKVAGKSGIEEVNVDAITGKVVAREHESPADEKAETRKDKQDKGKGGESEESGEHEGAAESE